MADAISQDNLSFVFSKVPEAASRSHPSSSRIGGGSSQQASGVDISILVPAVQELFEAGIANSTQRIYKSGDKRYNDFYNTFRLAPYPVTETQLSSFVAYLFKEGLSAATVKSYLAAVRHSQIAWGLGNPHINEMLRLEYIVKGLERKSINSNARPRLLMTPEILKAMKEVW